MIKTVIRTPEDMVFVFSENGRQVPEYQGFYLEVHELILRNAGTGTIFKHWPAASAEPEMVLRNNW
jgi:hypothetical protein